MFFVRVFMTLAYIYTILEARYSIFSCKALVILKEEKEKNYFCCKQISLRFDTPSYHYCVFSNVLSVFIVSFRLFSSDLFSKLRIRRVFLYIFGNLWSTFVYLSSANDSFVERVGLSYFILRWVNVESSQERGYLLRIGKLSYLRLDYSRTARMEVNLL